MRLWIATLRDGRTVKEDGYGNWLDFIREYGHDHISSVGILDRTGRVHVLKGSRKYRYLFFHVKWGRAIWALGGPVIQPPHEEEEVGMVVHPDGKCVVLNVHLPTGRAKVYYTTWHSLGLSADLYQIDLSRAGTEVQER